MKRSLLLVALAACHSDQTPSANPAPPPVADASAPPVADASVDASVPAAERGALRLGAVVVSGSVARAAVVRLLRQQYVAYRPCFERALGQRPTQAGRVTVHFEIDTTGKVIHATGDRASDIEDPEVQSCIVAAVQQISFPAPDDKQPVRVIAPVMYVPRDTLLERDD